MIKPHTNEPPKTLRLQSSKKPLMASSPSFDRLLALKQFDESKAGVKGLVDSGITSLPPFFFHPQNPTTNSTNKSKLSIPTVDLSLPRSTTVDLVRSAAKSDGFFHIVNHGIPVTVLDRARSSVRRFNELPVETRSKYYSREFAGGVSYASNSDLYRSAALSWRDTVQVQMAPVRPDPERLPEVCRAELLLLEEKVAETGRQVMKMLAEGLGVEGERLEKMSFSDGRALACHYYPWCPEPEKTLGLAGHTDPGVITVLTRDAVGGLQVKLEGEWVDVEPVDGALVINIGDLLQIISNDEYKSVEHRVVANPHKESRVSIAVFFNPGKRGDSDFYGPLPELVSEEKPAFYRNFTMPEFFKTFLGKGLSSKSLVDHFKL